MNCAHANGKWPVSVDDVTSSTLLHSHGKTYKAAHLENQAWQKRERERTCGSVRVANSALIASNLAFFNVLYQGKHKESRLREIYIFICSILDCFQMQAVKSSSLLA